MKNRMIYFFMAVLVFLNACSNQQHGEIYHGADRLAVWECGSGACVGVPDGGNGLGGSGGGTGRGDGGRAQGGGTQGGGTQGGSFGEEGDDGSGNNDPEKKGHGLGAGERSDRGSGSKTKEQEERERREAFEKASYVGVKTLEELESEQIIPESILDTSSFVPGNVPLREDSANNNDSSKLPDDLIKLNGEGDGNGGLYSALESFGLSNERYGKIDYQSDHKDELAAVHMQLDNAKPTGPLQYQIKMNAYGLLQDADNAFNAMETALGAELFSLAKYSADIVTDIVPFTSVPKDFCRAVVGIEPATGEKLEAWERVLAGSLLAVTILSAGTGKPILVGIGVMAKLIKAEAAEVRAAQKFAKLYYNNSQKVRNALREAIQSGVVKSVGELGDAEKLLPAIEKFKNQLSLRRIGNNGKIAVIGKGMNNVKEVKKFLNNEGIKPEIFRPSKKNMDKWNKLRETYKPKNVPHHEVVKSDIYIQNKNWIEKLKREGYTILDANNPENLDLGDFYKMELDSLSMVTK